MIRLQSTQHEQDWHMIREEVFVKEQGFHHEFDDMDAAANHITIYVDEKPAGCIRYFQEGASYRIGRLAVLECYRKLHLGSMLLLEAHKQISALQEHACIYLDAQCRVVPFYQKHGYQICGEEHMDEHVPHLQMVQQL